MPDNKEEIEIEIEAPGQEKPEKEIEIEVAEEKAGASPSSDDAVAELKRQLEVERNARLRAENNAQHGATEANKAMEERRKSEMQLLNGAIETLTREQEMLKNQLAHALATDEHSMAADIQVAMSDNSAKLTQMKMGKEAMENTPVPKFEPMQHTPNDPVEAVASQLSHRSAEWVRKHPEYVRNPNLYQKMVAAHNMAVADGLSADTDEYFRTVEGLLKITPAQQDNESALSQASQPMARRSAPPAAPVSRSNGADTTRARLTREEVEIAEMMGMTKEEYFKHKQQLKKEGRMN